MPVKVEQRIGRNVKTSTLYTKEELDVIFGGNIAAAAEAVGRTSEIGESVAGLELATDEYSARAMLFAGVGGNIGSINIDADTEVATIDISADQVTINNINFDDAAGTIGSSNFVAGSDGWQIEGSGDAEFNNVEVRGDVNTSWAHPSLGELVISPSSTAAFTTNAEADSITDDEFHERITRAVDGTDSSRSVKKWGMYKKRSSLDKIITTGIARQAGSAGEGGTEVIERSTRIYAKVTDQVTSATTEDFFEITSTSDQQFSFELDTSGMTDGNLVLLEISVYVDIDITNSSGDTEDTECWLREDVTARTAT